MKADRELDARVAEEVMGLEMDTVQDGYDIRFTIVEKGRDGHIRKPVPHYSTQIADAWLVVERLEDTKRALMIGRHTLSGERRWVVDIFRGDKRGPHRGIADTAPLAICLAALKAVA